MPRCSDCHRTLSSTVHTITPHSVGLCHLMYIAILFPPPPPLSILPRQCCCPYLQQAARGAQQGSLTDSTLPGTPAGKTVSSALHTSACSVDQHIYSLPHPLPHFYRIFRFDQCRCTLNQLCSAVEQSDDLRAQALYECSVFDTVLDTGL